MPRGLLRLTSIPKAFTDRLTTAETRAADAETKLANLRLATGTSKTPALAIGLDTPLTVPLTRPMLTDQYQVDIILPAPLIGTATVTVTSKTRTDVTLNLKTPLLIGAGQPLTVIAFG